MTESEGEGERAALECEKAFLALESCSCDNSSFILEAMQLGEKGKVDTLAEKSGRHLSAIT